MLCKFNLLMFSISFVLAYTGKKIIKDRNPKPNQRLVPNPDIQVPDKDPFFESR